MPQQALCFQVHQWHTTGTGEGCGQSMELPCAAPTHRQVNSHNMQVFYIRQKPSCIPTGRARASPCLPQGTSLGLHGDSHPKKNACKYMEGPTSVLNRPIMPHIRTGALSCVLPEGMPNVLCCKFVTYSM